MKKCTCNKPTCKECRKDERNESSWHDDLTDGAAVVLTTIIETAIDIASSIDFDV
jgi:hypothetical protein